MFTQPVSPLPSDQIRRIACVNFGGLGDEILFAPVLEAIRQQFPQAHITLFLEPRSRSVADLLGDIDETVGIQIQGQSRLKSFMALWKALRAQRFDVVISSGSNPLIAVLLALTGIPIRIGFETGSPTQKLLTAAALLPPKLERTDYAAGMYFELARAFLRLFNPDYQGPSHILPHLKPPGLSDLHWAKGLLQPDDPRRKILLHPGVSTVSVQKNILKGWSPHAWGELICLLAHAGHHVFLVGGPDDQEAVEAIRRALPPALDNFHDLYGKTENLKRLAALVQACDLLVGVDSSPIHIAVGYGKPLVAMFGPTDEKTLLPSHDPRFRAVTMPNLMCRPCLWAVRNESCNQPVCLNVPVSLMLAAIESTLSVHH